MASSYDALDYAPLTEPVSSADVQAFKTGELAAAPQKNSSTSTVALTIIASVFVVFIVIFAAASASSPAGIVPTVVGIIVVLLLGAAIYTSTKLREKTLAKLYKFATRNQLVFSHDIASPNYVGMIFGEGDSRILRESLVFPGSVEVGNYQYSTGSGKNRQTHHWGYVRIKLARRLPNMVLDAKSNNFFGVVSNLPDSFSKGQKLSLEGDFDNYFTLYAPEEYKTDALYVFTPDVMSAVIDSGKSYDMEVVDDNLMIYSGSDFSLTSPDELKSLLAIAEKIGDEIREQSEYYADERVASRSENVVAKSGQRLKKGVSWVLIVVIVLVVVYNLLHIIGVFRSNF